MATNLQLKFEDEKISSIKWRELRLGHKRLIYLLRRRNNKKISPHKIHENSLKNLEGEKYSGLMTEYARLGIKRAFEKMLVFCEPFMAWDHETKTKKKAVMIAWLFTLPEGYGDLIGASMNELISMVLDNLKHKYPLTMYIAKHEFTDADMPHTHLNVNTFMSYQYVHRAWCSLLKDQPCYIKWLADHPGHNPNSSYYDPESKDNLVGYRPLWTTGDCKDYLYCYLNKMSQNKIPMQGKVWFQSNTLRDSKLPLLSFSENQKDLLKEGELKRNIESFDVNWVHYKLDDNTTIENEIHHKNNLATVWKQKGKYDILNYLTQGNRYRLKQYRWETKHGRAPVYDVRLYTNFRTVYVNGDQSPGLGLLTLIDQEKLYSRREYSAHQN